VLLVALAALGAIILAGGGSATAQKAATAIDKTADQLTGSGAVKVGQELKTQIRAVGREWGESIKAATEK
jgi:hypothetical protein